MNSETLDHTHRCDHGRVRIGILGAARIAPDAIVKPSRTDPEASVVAVAARDGHRARLFATEHGIASAYGSYPELLADPNVDAVYIALPNGLHGRWAMAALAAGKHVLCEKPFAANADEAVEVADAARDSGLVIMEAFHYRYHALTARMLQIVRSGELGTIRRLSAWFCFPLLPADDIRWSFRLAGGAMMDAGCYAVHMVRTLAGSEPTVRSAVARTRGDVDRYLAAELDFPDGTTGSVTASMLSRRLLGIGVDVTGSTGTMRVLNPLMPQLVHRLVVRSDTRRAVEYVPRHPTTYAGQLRAFTGAVLRAERPPTGADDAIANMRVIDACYHAAELPRRQPTPD